MNAIGPCFSEELAAAGLTGLPFTWGEDGSIEGRENLTQEQNLALDAVVAAHDPMAVPLSAFPALTPRQLRLMMLQIGVSEQDVADHIAGIEDPEERAAAQIEWAWASVYRRDHPLVALLADAMEFNASELNDLWNYAAEL